MSKKGFWSDREYFSSHLIVHKFRQLQAKVDNTVKPRRDLLSFVQECAQRDLLLLLEATAHDAHLEDLCCLATMSDFWDDQLSKVPVRTLLNVCTTGPSFVHLQPQSSLSSFYLIKGAYYYALATLTASQEATQRNTRELYYLNLALEYRNFQALVSRTNHLNQLLHDSIRDQSHLDVTFITQTLKKLSLTADKYGAAGLLVVAKTNLLLSRYYCDILEISKESFHYLFSGYSAFVQAMSLAKMNTADVHNALLGQNLLTLLPNDYQSIADAISVYRLELSEAGVPEKHLLNFEQQATKSASHYITKYYLDQIHNQGMNIACH